MLGNPTKTRSAAVVGAWIDAACSVFKAVAGFAFGSYALVADAAHSASGGGFALCCNHGFCRRVRRKVLVGAGRQ